MKNQFQEIEERIKREGSYVYANEYQYLNQASLNDGLGSAEDSFDSPVLVQRTAFLSLNNPSASNYLSNSTQRTGIVTYIVQQGDNPSSIAKHFGISVSTLLWANNLSYWSVIKPGDKLVILPTSGVLHKVKKGETLSQIVKKYKGDIEETIAYNGLPADGSIAPGQSIIIPGGQKITPVYSRPTAQLAYRVSSNYGAYGGKSHQFPWGQCTWYVAQKRYIPWSGHAKYWLSQAKRYGFQIGTEPVPGAIVVTNESWYGHVAYVEAVNGDYITISEMNGIPWWKKGKLNIRVLHKNDWRIRGYIY